MLGQLIKGMGVDHVVWGTDAIWTGAPQWQIEALRRLRDPRGAAAQVRLRGARGGGRPGEDRDLRRQQRAVVRLRPHAARPAGRRPSRACQARRTSATAGAAPISPTATSRARRRRDRDRATRAGGARIPGAISGAAATSRATADRRRAGARFAPSIRPATAGVAAGSSALSARRHAKAARAPPRTAVASATRGPVSPVNIRITDTAVAQAPMNPSRSHNPLAISGQPIVRST